MKTIREWLSEGLTVEHYELISKYYRYWWDMRIVEHLCEALNQSIIWGYTEEGQDFWESIYYDIRENRYIKHSNNIFLKL